MKKKLLLLAISAIFATPSVFAATNGAANSGTNDDQDDLQIVNITVPQVALLNVEDTGLTGGKVALALVAPTNAGDGFSPVSSGTQNVKVSSNSQQGTTTTQTVTAQLDANVPASWKLQIIPAGITATGGTATTTANTITCISSGCDTANLITGIDNELINAGSIQYTFGPEFLNASNKGMAAHTNGGSRDTTITYTLSAS